jgi:hypothetical protein
MEERNNESSPLFKSWKGWYVLVIAFLALCIVFFYFFTQHYS